MEEGPNLVVRAFLFTLLGCVRRCPTLPHPLGCSTIGAERLSFRVRNGTGRFPCAMATETFLCCRPTPGVWGMIPMFVVWDIVQWTRAELK